MTPYFDPEYAREIAHEYVDREPRPATRVAVLGMVAGQTMLVPGEQPIGELVAAAFDETLDGQVEVPPRPSLIDADLIEAAGQLLAEAAREWARQNGHEEGWALKKAQEAARGRLFDALERGMGGHFG